MSKPIDGLERKIRSRPGATERIDARTDAMRSVLRQPRSAMSHAPAWRAPPSRGDWI